MKNLHDDGLLESLDYESFDACEPCLMGKMTKTPFFGTMERATNLLEIIHIDVVGFQALQTLERFELWGAHEEHSLPSSLAQRSQSLAR